MGHTHPQPPEESGSPIIICGEWNEALLRMAFGPDQEEWRQIEKRLNEDMSGSVKDIMAAVKAGGISAEDALDAEVSRPAPRVSLVAQLEAMIEPDEEDEPAEESEQENAA